MHYFKPYLFSNLVNRNKTMNNTWGLPQETYGLMGVQKHKLVIIKLHSAEYDQGKCRVQMSTGGAPSPTQGNHCRHSRKHGM